MQIPDPDFLNDYSVVLYRTACFTISSSSLYPPKNENVVVSARVQLQIDETIPHISHWKDLAERFLSPTWQRYIFADFREWAFYMFGWELPNLKRFQEYRFQSVSYLGCISVDLRVKDERAIRQPDNLIL